MLDWTEKLTGGVLADRLKAVFVCPHRTQPCLKARRHDPSRLCGEYGILLPSEAQNARWRCFTKEYKMNSGVSPERRAGPSGH